MVYAPISIQCKYYNCSIHLDFCSFCFILNDDRILVVRLNDHKIKINVNVNNEFVNLFVDTHAPINACVRIKNRHEREEEEEERRKKWAAAKNDTTINKPECYFH